MIMLITLALLLLCGAPAFGEGNAPAGSENADLLVMFWNVENFFDYHSSSAPKYWTYRRFTAKCNAVCKTVLAVASAKGRVPDVIGLAEVENEFVLRSLAGSTLLRKLGYKIVHYESPDRRGIDCALLYRGGTLSLLGSSPKHVVDTSGVVIQTRDILLAEFPDIAILVNHHPSKIGGKSDRREKAMSRMLAVVDSLTSTGCKRVVAIGDFNDDLWGPKEPEKGTIKYNGAWEKIDGHFSFGAMEVEEEIFDAPFLLIPDKTFGGQKPRRTFVGPRYAGGVSDHLPIVITIKYL